MRFLPRFSQASRSLVLVSVFALSFGVASCSDDDDAAADPAAQAAALKKEIVQTYATHVHTNYDEAVTAAKALQTAVNAFVATPTSDSFEAAKKAWKESRPSYELSETYRFYGGPIDDNDGPEGRINSWPLDENYVDYTVDMPEAGLVSDLVKLPTITKEAVAKLNEAGGEKNLSTGYHAIEFLLWGQDLNDAGHEMDPGRRPYTDYVTGAGGTATNQARRGAYLKAVTDLLVDDLASVEVQWRLDDASTYGAQMVAGDAKKAITNMLKGMGSLAFAELSRDRMDNAYKTKDQEEEHSCFSDNTTPVDLVNAALGIQNVYLGTYGSDTGTGLDKLVASVDPALDAKMKTQIATVVANIEAIPAPFDQAILGADTDDGRVKIKAAIDALITLAGTIAEVANALDIELNFE